MTCTRFNKNQGYIGAGIQEAKAVYVAPEPYIPATDETALTPTMENDMQREAGDGIYPGHTIKTLHKMDGSLNVNVKADLITFLFTAMFGNDTVTGGGLPYTHTIIPNENPCAIPWITLYRDVAGQIQERFTDCRIKEITIAGETGNRITAAVSLLGLTSNDVTLVYEPTYEDTANMFMFYDGIYTKDSVAIGTISAFSITFRAIVVEDDQTTGIELADAPVIRFEIETTFTLDVDTTNQAEYDVVYYLNGAANTALDDGTLQLTFNNGLATTLERSLQIDLHKLIYTAQPVEMDASSDSQLTFEVTAHCEKHSSNGLATITTESSRLTGQAATRAFEVYTLSDDVSDGEIVTIGSIIYEFKTAGDATGNNIKVDVSGGVTNILATTALIAAINGAATSEVWAIAGSTTSKTNVTANIPGLAGNALASTTDAANGSFTAATLAGGTDNG